MGIFYSVLTGLSLGVIASAAGLSLTPTPATQALSIVYHLLAYWFLGFFLSKTLAHSLNTSLAVYTAFFIALCIGGFDELFQSYVPGRDSSFEDWLLDAVGAFFGATTGPSRDEALAFLLKQMRQTPLPRGRDA